MAKIIRTREATGELFPLSLIAVSDDLYHNIAEAIRKQFGKSIREITRDQIERKLNSHDIIITTRKRTIFLPIVVIDVFFLPSYESCLVSARLLFPLYGKEGKIKRLLGQLIKEVGLENAFPVGCGIEVKIALNGEDMPYQITPSPLHNGNDQKAFATKKEILSCSSIR